ncbi:ABC transporter ATP-binding protein [Azospirillum thermophilum]|uniref:Sugar ABC transporter ATP-binding protein n=1 Tax=Azospirillum thermophilum TaxID=2202148 RepID=A0A2S2D0A8_9PROT|nr:ABC transporter ATP-binding protein [Azospirillum thermophilum]AWK90194.1 sugar ABC transporter ATP-binding protein [Azospirillum thermophilum]
MTSSSVIEVAGLGKNFKLYNSAGARIASWLRGDRPGDHKDNWVLRGVDFTVQRGECVGIIGRNGSGKSTLLKMITGTLHPTEGSIRVDGRVLALLELGTGFNVELTGRQNVSLSAELHGFDPDYATRRMDDIERFADIGPFFDRPVKTYSSGMFVRLAFSIFLFMEPDILIVDEALSVGDLFFQQKCFEAIQQIKDRGTTLLFVSHDMSAVRNICDRAVLLDGGRATFIGAPDEAVMHYYQANTTPSPAGTAVAGAAAAVAEAAPAGELIDTIHSRSILDGKVRLGNGGLEITAARVCTDAGADVLEVRSAHSLNIWLALKAHERIVEPNVGVEVYDRFNQLIYGVSLRNLGHVLEPMEPGRMLVVHFRLRFSVMPGEYSISLATAEQHGTDDQNAGRFLDRHDKLGPILVFWDQPMMKFYGVAELHTDFEVFDPSAAPARAQAVDAE